MAEQQPGKEERRVYTRYELAFPIQLEVAVPGGAPILIRGATINVSRGGILAALPKGARNGARCRVTFEHAKGRVAPVTITGIVVHVSTWKHGRRAVAVRFNRPLEVLKPYGEL